MRRPATRSQTRGKRETKRVSAAVPPAGSSSRRKERRARDASLGGRVGRVDSSIVMCFVVWVISCWLRIHIIHDMFRFQIISA